MQGLEQLLILDCLGLCRKSKEVEGLTQTNCTPANREIGPFMPSDFGEIAGYHSRIALRYQVLAQAARANGNLSEADYNAALAARYIQAANEQMQAMRDQPGRPMAQQRANRQFPGQQSTSPGSSSLSAILHGTGQLVASIRKVMPKRSDPFYGLTLR
ncbi:MAG: hypothetical protein ABSF70_06370 [Terracidiphilus sp.]|jgi:hypothetical protein